MQCEQAHPPGGMDRILMWVVAGFGDPMRDIVDSDDEVRFPTDGERLAAAGLVADHQMAVSVVKHTLPSPRCLSEAKDPRSV